MNDKKPLSERDICTKFITPAIKSAGWDIHSQIREEVTLTAGRIIVRGQAALRAKGARADYVLYHKPGIPLAVLEAKDNRHSVGAGLQQALDYADLLNVPFAFSSNGDAFMFHDRSGGTLVEREIALGAFPSPQYLWSASRHGRATLSKNSPSSPRTISTTAAARRRATTRSARSTLRWRRSPAARNACCWSWQPAPARLTPPFKSSGGCGKRAPGNGSYFSPTATSWSIRPRPTTSSPSAPP